MSYNPSPEAFPQMLAMLAEIGRPLTATQVADLLRINPQTAHRRLRTLFGRGLLAREYGEDKKQVLWSLKNHEGQRINGFSRHGYGVCLAALEQAVRGWYGITRHARSARR